MFKTPLHVGTLLRILLNFSKQFFQRMSPGDCFSVRRFYCILTIRKSLKKLLLILLLPEYKCIEAIPGHLEAYPSLPVNI